MNQFVKVSFWYNETIFHLPLYLNYISTNKYIKIKNINDSEICLVIIIAEVLCDFPGYLRNGKIVGNDYSYGKTITYTCNPGFKSYGEPERVCDTNGNWTKEPAICDGLFSFLV